MHIQYTRLGLQNSKSLAAKRRGWWRINSKEQLQELLSKLQLRGIRERQLLKTLEKHEDFATSNMQNECHCE